MNTLYIVVIIIFAIVLHEFAHGIVAYWLGDTTAKKAGRLTLNPIKHVDPFGTIILPGILVTLQSLGYPVIPLGWAKPVPVNMAQLRQPKRDMMLVGMAGPLVNLVLAIIFSQIIRLELSDAMFEVCLNAVIINLVLIVFNMMPIPPLDGSRLVAFLLPNQLAIKYLRLEPYGIVIVMILLYMGVFERVLLPVIRVMCNILGIEI